MMTRDELLQALQLLGHRLAERGGHADIVIAGGAWMVLLLGSRGVTKDIDTYFAPPTDPVHEAVQAVANELGRPGDWLNDGIKGLFFGTPPQELWANYEDLSVYAVTADYVLALKIYAARNEDQADVQTLIRHLGIQSVDDALNIVERYIPKTLLTSKHTYFAEACMEGVANGALCPPHSGRRLATSRGWNGSAAYRTRQFSGCCNWCSNRFNF